MPVTGASFGPGCSFFSRRFETSREMETTSFPWPAVYPQLAPHHFYKTRGNRQAEPSPAEFPGCGSIRLRERLENHRLLILGDADARVADIEAQPDAAAGGIFLERHVHGHLAASGELDGVAHQIGHDLSQADRVADDIVRDFALHFEQKLQALRMRPQRERLNAPPPGSRAD